jgi:hypothetical protein
MDALRHMDRHGADTVQVREDAAALQRRPRRAYGGDGLNTGRTSWYLDRTGRNSMLWADWTWRVRQRTASFDPDDFEPTQRTAGDLSL